MKKLIGMMLLCATMVLSFASCSNENDDFDYPIEIVESNSKCKIS